MSSQNFYTFRRNDSWVQKQIDALPRGQKTKIFYRAMGEHFARQSMPDEGLDLIHKVYVEVHRAAVNINQISRKVNSNDLCGIQVTHDELRAAYDEMMVVQRQMEKIIDHWRIC